MEQIGYSLIDSNNIEIKFWGDNPGICAEFPNPVVLPNGDRVHAGALGPMQQWRLVPRRFTTGDVESVVFNDPDIVVTRLPPPLPEPGTISPRLIASALSIEVANGDVSTISGAFNLVAAVYLDVGQYMLLFLTPQPDANYFPVVTGSAPNFAIDEKTTDYIIIHALSGLGAAIDPASFSVQVFRTES